MIFTIIINSAPLSTSSGTANNALKFSQTLIEQGHSIYRLFFYGDGIQNLNTSNITPQGEFNFSTQWQELIQTNEIDCVVCIAAAIRRGVFDNNEAKRHKFQANLAASSELSGLGQLIEATQHSDRTITFG